ncbi:hypothetical protein CEE37_05570 [candidate division LCP-89 bacterium B3_LCP]|uniref:Peptidase M14 domain-containing protein n=1 Tax=candidate division LCP-89 bacterium B3_LCP TaxID=2012998 RepID=A0A532V2B8_UNCL8|nr:MAG: hypothetical protein CEE37_05570 [candidate division LCP-89 bacterium B3_LCP]
MSYRLFLMGLIIAGFTCLANAYIDPGYHDNQEIYDEIVAWQELYPDTVRVDTIGYSQEDGLPIWAVKISDNVHQDEDEPTVLFVGQVHAEELIGVEITLALITDILEHRFQYPWKAWLRELEIWIVPTLNPEGHAVVMTDSMDNSYRKNKRDCNLNGIFDYQSGMGGDIDGVDLNRNFPLNWVHGDSFLYPGHAEYYDYFRGFSPLGENETQTIWELGEQEKFSFSIFWHSSRQDPGVSEQLFYPWGWADETKTSPDFEVIDYIAEEVHWLLPKIGTGYYIPVPTSNPVGNQHDSFYAYFGTLGFLIEAGPGIQEPYTIVEEVVDVNIDAAGYLLNRASEWTDMIHSQLTGIVTDAVTGLPLSAEVIIPQLNGAYLKPRTCDPTYGRYRRMVMPGTYDIEVRMRGYYPQMRTGVFANPSGPIDEDFDLEPKPEYLFHGEIREVGGGTLPCTMYIFGEDVQDTLVINPDGQYSCCLPEGQYGLIMDSQGFVVKHDSVSLDQNQYIEFQLSGGIQLFSDDFDGGLSYWVSDGTYDQWCTELADSLWTGMIAASSPHLTPYEPFSENWLEITTPFDLSSFVTASLSFVHWQYFEPGYDFGEVQVSTDGGGSWETLAGPFEDQDVGWGSCYTNLTPYCGSGDVRFRWLIFSDESLEEQGWRIDEVEVMAADTVVSVQPDTQIPHDYTLLSAFPNPFNAQLNLLISLPNPEYVGISLWDVSGRLVDQVYQGDLNSGQTRLTWKANMENPSGIYFLRLEDGSDVQIHKVLYLK